MKAIDQIEIARFVLDGFDQRARVIDILDDLQKNSLDFYSQLRSLSQQRRAAELRHGAAPETGADFYQDPNKSTGAAGGAPQPARPQAGQPPPSGAAASAPPPPSPRP